MSDALFGVDGTELPQPWADPSGRGGGRGPELPPLTLPAIPGFGVTREEIAAAYSEGRTLLADQHHDPSSAQQPAAAPSAAAPKAPPAHHVLSAHALAANALAANAVSARVPARNVLSAHATASLLAPAAPELGGPSAAVAPDRSRSRVPAPVPPGKLAPPTHRSLFFRPLRAVGSRTPVLLSDLRRRVGDRQGAGLPLQLGSGGGAGVFFFIALIIFLVLAYGIIAGIVESVIRLFQS